jgi:hypothetical protein
MPIEKRNISPDAINPTAVEQVKPGKFRFKKAVSSKTAGTEITDLHTMVKTWEDSDSLSAAEFRALTKRTMLFVLRSIIWLATRSSKGA